MQLGSKSAAVSSRGGTVSKDSDAFATCEVLTKGRWTTVSLGEALGLPPARLKRCCECHGGLEVHRAEGGAPARFVHGRPHPGCSRDGSFAGKRSRHPRALT